MGDPAVSKDATSSSARELIFPFCDEVSKYEKIAKIGQGTFGEVFKARHHETLQYVALKKVLMDNEKEGFPITAIREIKILQLLKHENIVNLIEICRTRATHYNRNRATVFLVFEFCEHDLAGLLSNQSVRFSLGEIKKILQMLLEALFYIHYNKILHRDMKASNILITKAGVLKLADFGLARAIHQSRDSVRTRYTNRVVTLWYRPPELLLGERNYGPAIDMWGAGCITAEMWTRSPIMQGTSEQQQLVLISRLCGSISPASWPNVDRLELFKQAQLPQDCTRQVRERMRSYLKDPNGLDLLDKLLELDPSRRADSDTALSHDFFWTEPLPQPITSTLSQLTTSNFEFFANNRRTGTRTGPNNAQKQTVMSSIAPQNINGANFDRVF